MVTPTFSTVACAISGNYRGVMQHEQTYNQSEALADLARGTAYNKSDIKTVLTSFTKVLKKKLDASQCVVIPGSVRIHPSVAGGFMSSIGPWDPAKNTLTVIAQSLSPLRTALGSLRPVNNTDGAKPKIDTVKCGELYDVISAGSNTTITGKDLLIDTEKTDEFVALLKADGTVAVKGTLSVNTLAYLECSFNLTGLEAGTYTLAVYTRSGMGSEYGVAVATRTVNVVVA